MVHQNRVNNSLALSILNLPEGKCGRFAVRPGHFALWKVFVWNYTKTVGPVAQSV